MCKIYPENDTGNTPMWFKDNHDSSPYNNPNTIDWTRIGTILTDNMDGTNKEYNLALKWYTDRTMDNSAEIINILGGAGYPIIGRDQLPENVTIQDIKNDISRDVSVSCTPSPPPGSPLHSYADRGNHEIKPITCGVNGKMGPENIIREQIEYWVNNYYKKQPKSGTKVYSGDLDPLNPEFESCMNKIFEDNILDDEEIIQEINNIKKLSDLKSQHIQYIKRKLMAFLLDKNEEAISKCITDHLYIDDTVCTADLPKRLSHVLKIIMLVIGYNLELEDITNNVDNKAALMNIIDELGDLIPKVFEQIIDISERAEARAGCKKNGATEILRKLNKTIFKPKKNIVKFNIFEDMYDGLLNTTSEKFNRSTALMMLGIAFLKFI